MILFAPKWIFFTHSPLSFNWQPIVCCLGTPADQTRFVFSLFGTVLLQSWKTAASFPKTVFDLLAESSKAKYKMHLGMLFSAFHVLGEGTTVLHMWLTELGRIAVSISACTTLHTTQIISCCRAKQNNPVLPPHSSARHLMDFASLLLH